MSVCTSGHNCSGPARNTAYSGSSLTRRAPPNMTRMNWRKVRYENLIQAHGATRVPPGKAWPRRASKKSRKKECPNCHAAVRIERYDRHIQKKCPNRGKAQGHDWSEFIKLRRQAQRGSTEEVVEPRRRKKTPSVSLNIAGTNTSWWCDICGRSIKASNVDPHFERHHAEWRKQQALKVERYWTGDTSSRRRM
jgi:hypothetical protein